MCAFVVIDDEDVRKLGSLHAVDLRRAGPLYPLRIRPRRAAARQRVIAVVLSGYGNDAATGATAVHHFGGTVIAASPQSSTAPAMPEATIRRDHATDHIVAVDEVGALLLAMTTVPILGDTKPTPGDPA